MTPSFAKPANLAEETSWISLALWVLPLLEQEDRKMNNRVETDRDRNPQQQRRTYQPPRLMTYGAVRELTASGTGAQREAPGNMPITKQPRA
jgi:hypothetical protein